MKTKIIFVLHLVFSLNILVSQENKNMTESLDIKLPSSVKIFGTSTLHDWTSIVEKTDATIVFEDITTAKIETLNVKVDVYSIKSGKKLMDKLTYKALKAEKYPSIQFVFKKAKIIEQTEDFIELDLNGDLSIAGVTKNINVITKINRKGKAIFLTGSHQLKMTSFGIKPPKALLGTIKTGDEITIEFSLKF